MSDNPLVNQQQNPADLAHYNYGDMAQAGYENTGQQDQLIPFLAILQALSPQVQQGTPEYIEGARTGQLFNTATREVIDGQKGERGGALGRHRAAGRAGGGLPPGSRGGGLSREPKGAGPGAGPLPHEPGQERPL